MGGAVMTKLLFHLEICSKNAGLQGSTLSGHRMTTGFGPFELPHRMTTGFGPYELPKNHHMTTGCGPLELHVYFILRVEEVP